jgi:hypothetical protein
MYPCPDCGKPTDRSRCHSCAGKLGQYRRANNLGPVSGQCADCGAQIAPRSTRCLSCEVRRKWKDPRTRKKLIRSISRANSKGGLPHCGDCGVRLKHYSSTRCPSCAQKHKWKNPAFRKKFYAHNPYFGEGPDHPRWRGGKGPDSWRHSPKGRQWRTRVYKRDNYTCQICGAHPQRPHAHHIRSAKRYPKLRYEISNGITLCEQCHARVHLGEISIMPALFPHVTINLE